MSASPVQMDLGLPVAMSLVDRIESRLGRCSRGLILWTEALRRSLRAISHRAEQAQMELMQAEALLASGPDAETWQDARGHVTAAKCLLDGLRLLLVLAVLHGVFTGQGEELRRVSTQTRIVRREEVAS